MKPWTVTTIGKLFSSIRPGDWGIDGTVENGTPVLRSTNFRNDCTIDFSDLAYRQVNERRLSNGRVTKGAILIEKAGGSTEQAAGRIVFCDRDFQGTASNFIDIARVAEEHCPRFIAYFLHHLYKSGLVMKYQQQTTGIINFKLRDYMEETVLIPGDKREQAKIAEVIATASEAFEKTADYLAKQQRIATGLMQDLLTRGVDKSGQLRSHSTHKFYETALGSVPVDWWVASVGELFDQRKESGRVGLPIMSVVMKAGLIERASGDRRVESNLPPERHALVLNGDIAYNMMRMWQGVLGRAQFDCLVSPAYVVLRPNKNITSCFAEWLFRDERSILKFRKASRGVVDDRLRLYPRDLFSIKFAIPKDVTEQKEIARRLASIKYYMAQEAALLRLIERTRAGLAHDLLTGKKRVTALLEQQLPRAKAYA